MLFRSGEEWLDETVLTEIRRFVYNGGGFVGVGEPSAIHSGGRFFQLADVLGVDKELGFGLSTDRYWKQEKSGHFLKEDENREFSFGEGMKDIYSLSEETEIVVYSQGSVQLSANPYGKGRGVYIAGLPYSHENTRLLLRSLYYSAGREADLKLWFAENLWCEVHAYPEKGLYAVVNNSQDAQNSEVYDGTGRACEVQLAGSQILWKDI